MRGRPATAREILSACSAQVIAQYRSGFSCGAVARHFGVSDTSVKLFLIAHGVELREPTSSMIGRRRRGEGVCDALA